MKYFLLAVIFISQLFSTETKDFVGDQDKIIFSAGTYTMSEADTIIDARKIALEYAKANALEEAGTIVESKININADSSGKRFVKQEVQAYASGLLKVEVLEATLNGKIYRVKIKATVDSEKLNNFQTLSPETKHKISELEKSNKESLARLKQLETKLQSTIKMMHNSKEEHKTIDIEQQVEDLKEERKSTLIKISENDRKIVFFISDGTVETLFDQGKSKLSKVQKDIEKNVFNILKTGDVKIEDLEVLDNGDGTSNLFFNFSFTVNGKDVCETLYKYFNIAVSDSYLLEGKSHEIPTGCASIAPEFVKIDGKSINTPFEKQLFKLLIHHNSIGLNFMLDEKYFKSILLATYLQHDNSLMILTTSTSKIFGKLSIKNIPNYVLKKYSSIKVKFITYDSSIFSTDIRSVNAN